MDASCEALPEKAMTRRTLRRASAPRQQDTLFRMIIRVLNGANRQYSSPIRYTNSLTDAATFSWDYERAEIIADGAIHAIGVVLGLAGGVVLLSIAFGTARSAEITPAIIYVVGLLSMLGLSAAYNMWPVSPRKWMLRRFDHSSIYLLIAATYTAFLLHVESGIVSEALLTIIWLTSAAGIALKLLWPGCLDRLSIGLYLMLGWSGALAYKPIAATLHPTTLWLIVVGGAIYSIGVLFHVWQRLRFHNAIWHCFVLSAATVHYVAVLSCVT
jgi:hemolysin III